MAKKKGGPKKGKNEAGGEDENNADEVERKSMIEKVGLLTQELSEGGTGI